MNFNFSAWAIRNPVPPILLFFVLMLLGIVSFKTMAIEQFPNIDVPVVVVSVAQSGATPSELEAQVTKTVEDAVAGISGIDHIDSTMSDGSSTTVIRFRLEVPTQKALQDVKDAVTRIRSTLPAGIDDPIVESVDVENQAIQTFAVKAPGMTLEQLSWYVDDVVKRQIQAIPGVGRVEAYGKAEREIRINLDPAKLQSFGVTAAQVNQQLAATNTDAGAGRGNVGGVEQAIRTLGGAKTLGELRDTKITLPGGRDVRLGDIGQVLDSTAEQRTFARVNGDDVLAFSIFRSKGSSSTEVAKRVQQKIDDLAKLSNGAASFKLIDDTVYYIYGNYTAAMEGLIEGAILAVVVVLLFLRNFRATLITAIALPLSAFPAFWMMKTLGFSLNLVSFLAITLATGILVDDAIVEIENIARHMKMGKSPYRAALEAADEIGLAVIAITFSIIMIFAPVSFMGGIAGQYFRQFGLTVAVAVFFSLVVARLITPMMAAYLMKGLPHQEPKPGLLMRFYIWLLHILNHPVPIMGFRPNLMSYVTILLSIGVLFGSVQLFKTIPFDFIPKGDEGRFVLSLEMPPGTSIDKARDKTDIISAHLLKNPEIENVFVLGGSSPTGSVEPRRASIFVKLHNRDVGLVNSLWGWAVNVWPVKYLNLPQPHWEGRTTPQPDIEQAILPPLSNIPDIKWAKINERGARDIQYDLLSNDPVALRAAAAKLQVALRASPKLRAPEVQGETNRPEIQITPRTSEASKLGITTQEISQAVRVATIGDFGPLLAKFSIDGRQVPIRVQIPEKERASFSQLQNLRLPTATGSSVPLSSVADIKLSEGPSSIERHDRARKELVGADLPPGTELGVAGDIIEKAFKDINAPESVRLAKGGDAEVQQEFFLSFIQAGGLGVVLMLAILILLLGNFFAPFSIIFSLPLSLGGVVLALKFTHQSFSMPVIIGMLMLIGIVAKNAIMLVDFAVERKKHGMERVEAVIDAGLKRARPIVMTTIAMGAGMFPTALGIGEGGSFRAPMAAAVIGGLIVSTILSLVFVPSYYIFTDDLARLTRWIFGRFIGATDEAPAVNPELESVRGALAKTASTVDQLDDKIDAVAAKLEQVAKSAVKKTPKLAAAAE